MLSRDAQGLGTKTRQPKSEAPTPSRPHPLIITFIFLSCQRVGSHAKNFDMDSIVFIRKIATLSGEQCLLRPGSGAVDTCIAHAYTRDRYFDLTDLHSSQGGASCAGFGF